MSDVDRITLEMPAGGAYSPVARLVVGGVGARCDLPVDRVDELGMLMDAVLAIAPQKDAITIEISRTGGELRLRLGPFPTDPRSSEVTHRLAGILSNHWSVEQGPAGHHLELEVLGAGR